MALDQQVGTGRIMADQYESGGQRGSDQQRHAGQYRNQRHRSECCGAVRTPRRVADEQVGPARRDPSPATGSGARSRRSLQFG